MLQIGLVAMETTLFCSLLTFLWTVLTAVCVCVLNTMMWAYNRTCVSVKVKADIPLAHSFSLSTG